MLVRPEKFISFDYRDEINNLTQKHSLSDQQVSKLLDAIAKIMAIDSYKFYFFTATDFQKDSEWDFFISQIDEFQRELEELKEVDEDRSFATD